MTAAELIQWAAFAGLFAFSIYLWRKTMTDAESIAALITRQTAYEQQSKLIADQITPAIAQLQISVGRLVSAAQGQTHLVPQAIVDAATAAEADGQDTQTTLDSWTDALAKVKAETDTLGQAATALATPA